MTQMSRTSLFRVVALVCVSLYCVAAFPVPVRADRTEESAPPGSGTRTIESGPSLSSMEREGGSEGWSYNTEYLFGLSKHVRDSSMPSGAKEVVFVFAFLVDIPLLPFAAIAGLFGE
jgi:hypothetical protein